jgi:hypothetical protein
MSEVLVVKDKVQRTLTQVFNTVNVSELGFTVPYESTQCWVDFHVMNDPEVVARRKELDMPTITVSFWALIAQGARGSADMFEWIAVDGQMFNYGSVNAVKRDDGLFNVLFEYRIAGESCDPMEIKNAVISVCTSADDLDEEFTKRFGGSTFSS